MPFLCTNCHCLLKFDASITDRYPEWQSMCMLSKPAAAVYRRQHGQLKSPDNGVTYLKNWSLSAASSGSAFSRCSDKTSPFSGSTEMQRFSSGNLGHATAMIGNLFDIICNDVSAIDNPMCQECADKLLDCMDQQMKQLEEECNEYREMLENLKADQEGTDFNSLKTELWKLQSEEAGLRVELARLEAEEAELDEKLSREEKGLNEISEEEESLWKNARNVARQLISLNDENQSVANQLRYANTQLEKLQKTNAFNVAFHIWHDGHFGTINGFRLGRLPNCFVDWSEINAAWGQAALLLHCMRKKINMIFERYEIVPYGSHSFIRCLQDDDGRKKKSDNAKNNDDKRIASSRVGEQPEVRLAPSQISQQRTKDLPLFCSGGYKFFWDTKFDSAMVAFLDCLQQFKQRLDETGGGCLPYKMHKDKVEDKGKEFSVKIQFNSEERWTKAMKCVLTNLKWALVCVSSMQ